MSRVRSSRLGGATAEDHRAGGAVDLRNGDHHRRLHRHQAALRGLPLLQGLELDRMRREVGHVQAGQDLLRRGGVVVGGTTHQREAGQRDDGIDNRFALVEEELFDRRARVESAGKGRDHPQPTRLELP
jgi:hypothetical protein